MHYAFHLALRRSQRTLYTRKPIRHLYERETYFVHGALSHYVRSAHKGAILDLFPKAKLMPIPNAAHWVHFDQPGPFVECVLACLEADTQ